MLHHRGFLTLFVIGLSIMPALFSPVEARAKAPAETSANVTDILYVAKPMAIQSGPGNAVGKIGRIYTASRISVLKRQPGWLQISVRAWHQDGAARVLYALPGKRILVSILKKTAISVLRPVSEVLDADTEILWKQVTFTGWIRPKELVASLDDLWTPAWELFATRCTVCHQRRIPHHYTANQWRSLIKVMGPRTGLVKSKQQLILTYLQYHASDTLDDHSEK